MKRDRASLASHKQDWEDLAILDPLWAILSDSSRTLCRWNVDEFFASGNLEVERLLRRAEMLGYPLRWRRALDFGCGVGRLTQAMSKVFEECYGVDISNKMIELARNYNRNRMNCKFIANAAPDLGMFPDEYFDMTYSSITLQHIPEKGQILSYISEFIRTLSPGGLLAFQLPSYLSLKHRLQPRRRLYGLLRRAGFDRAFLYRRLGLYPVRINFVPENEILILLECTGAKVLELQRDSVPGLATESCTYFVTRQM